MAAGDVNGDGHADIITGPGAGGGPIVRVFDGVTGAMLNLPVSTDAAEGADYQSLAAKAKK